MDTKTQTYIHTISFGSILAIIHSCANMTMRQTSFRKNLYCQTDGQKYCQDRGLAVWEMDLFKFFFFFKTVICKIDINFSIIFIKIMAGLISKSNWKGFLPIVEQNKINFGAFSKIIN